MNCWQLDSGDASLVFSAQEGRLCLEYVGCRLPAHACIEALSQLATPVVPHGELDRNAPPLAFPTEAGCPSPMPALRLRRDGEALWLAPRLVEHESTACGVLQFTCADDAAGVALSLDVSATTSGGWLFTVSIENTGTTSLSLDWLASAHLPLPDQLDQVTHFGGYWANEFQKETTRLGRATQVWRSDRGRTGHGSTAALLAHTSATTENAGEVLSVALAWSGNHQLSAAPLAQGGHGVQVGQYAHPGEISLAPGERYVAPPAKVIFSTAGYNGIRAVNHRDWRTQHRPAPRRLHFNSWEGCYFDHDETRMLELVQQARLLGAERFVLDDGWMAGRTGPGVGLGDWQPCPERYPRGLAPIADAVRDAGMTFGVWVEPEGATLDSQLAASHPDWLIGAQSTAPVTGRSQFLLDLTQDAVQQHILATLTQLVTACSPDYIKWDMNRDYAQLPANPRNGPLALARAWQQLVAQFRQRHPEVVLELCASGGARNDAGAMQLADRLWPTDSLDPLQRFNVLRHSSLLLPIERLGWHVGQSMTETSGVSTPASTRAALAMLGHMGLELNPVLLSAAERAALDHWIPRFKRHREWLAQAQVFWLDAVADGASAVMLVHADQHRALLWFLQQDYPRRGTPPRRQLVGLAPSRQYQVQILNPEDCAFAQSQPDWQRGMPVQVSGELLMTAGLRQPPLRAHQCAVIELSGASD